MKTCESINKLYDQVIYNELNKEELKKFHTHINNCKNCEAEYIEYKNTLHFMKKRKQPEIKEEFWDNYWENLSEKAFLQKPTIQDKLREYLSVLYMDHKKFVLPAAAALLILFGLFLGKIFFSPESPQLLKKTNTLKIYSSVKYSKNDSGYYSMVNNHIDSIKPIFAEYKNYQVSEEQDSDLLLIKKEMLKKLILQNYLLKRIAAKKNDSQLKSVIEDLELILLEILNGSSEEEEKINSVKYMLDGSDILFKMNMLRKKKKLYKNAGIGERI